MMNHNTLKVHPADNVIVALETLEEGQEISFEGQMFRVIHTIPAKHKVNVQDLRPGDKLVMYGVTVGKATQEIPAGSLLTQANVKHAAAGYEVGERTLDWQVPDITAFAGKTFNGFHRADGKVGTRNYWLVIPLVFCENRNIKVIREAMLKDLGYLTEKEHAVDVQVLMDMHRQGASEADLMEADITRTAVKARTSRFFPQVDGIKFLTHEGGCGGIRQDSDTLCQLLAGYITHPNVAGATVLSLGCQNAQIPILKAAILERDPEFAKPVYYLEQQQSKSERAYISDAVKYTFLGLTKANQAVRKPAPLSALALGLECGGSDGFSGISANPSLGFTSDLLVALGGKAILAEFPELNGVEQNLINRCVDEASANKFSQLMKVYAQRAEAAGSGFDMNPSPGNIKDGLITDAMKSAGAAKKGGTSPVTSVLDYTEPATKPGLNLLCTPGNDVESTTGLAGSWANMIVFTTGLGTPTGNPITPVIKLASNDALASRMHDLIDMSTGAIIAGSATIEQMGAELLTLIIQVANGERITKAEALGQDDFIPWKRGISL